MPKFCGRYVFQTDYLNVVLIKYDEYFFKHLSFDVKSLLKKCLNNEYTFKAIATMSS